MKRPDNPQDWQTTLHERFMHIDRIAQISGSSLWKKVTPMLRKIPIERPPWWWRAVKREHKEMNASVFAPPVLANKIFLFDNFWGRSLQHQCSILVHEWVHLMQIEGKWNPGKPNFWKYYTDSSYKHAIESAAYTEQKRFLDQWRP